nr:MAG TPA: hypothetical protein [Caudoviricetes sp.]
MWRIWEVYLWNGLTTGGSLLNIRSWKYGENKNT